VLLRPFQCLGEAVAVCGLGHGHLDVLRLPAASVRGGASGELGRIHASALTSVSMLALGYVITFGSLLAYSCYEWLIRNAPSPLVGTYAFVNPIVSVLLGWWLLAEPIGARTLLAAAVIVAGVALLVIPVRQSRERRARRAVRAEHAETIDPAPGEPTLDLPQAAELLGGKKQRSGYRGGYALGGGHDGALGADLEHGGW
jgi:hypothetical protein